MDFRCRHRRGRATGEITEAAFDDVRPNRLVFDLDPGPGVELADCARVARAVRERMPGSALVPVTSGSKGIHLYSWLDGSLTSDEASAYAREVAEAIEQDLPDLVVSRMAKSLRRGKVFIDWSQNNGSKTTIAPYSLRGREWPTVAAPRSWEELADPELRHLEYGEVLELLATAPDPMWGLETGDNDGAETRGGPGRGGRAQRDSKLDTYRSMRSAEKTPEPVPEPGLLPHGEDDTFVIQEHHARRLHYDFRLERAGVLVSWAVPKGVPESTGRNHLAVHTEDHPMDYANFAGEIPHGEYGGGTVTIWDRGTYATEKWRDDEVIVVLHGGKARGRYALIRTGGKNWLMHRMKDQSPAPKHYDDRGDDPRPAERPGRPTPPAPPKLPSPPKDLRPMLAAAGSVTDVSDDGRWRFEGKWDGIRAIATVGPSGLTLRSRLGNDVTHTYPELAVLVDLLDGHTGVLDGEIVALDDGRTSFHEMQKRMNVQRARDVARVMREVSVQFWLFDVLHLDGISLLDKRYDDRRRILEALPLSGGVCLVPPQLAGHRPGCLAGQRRSAVGGHRRQARRIDLPTRPAFPFLDQDQELPGSGGGDRRLVARFRSSRGHGGIAVAGGPGRRRPASVRRQGRHRLHRCDSRPADGDARPAADRPISGRRHRAEDGCRRRRVGASRVGGGGQVRAMDPGTPAPGDELAGAATGQDGGRSRPGAQAMSQVSRRAPCAGVTVGSTGVVYRWCECGRDGGVDDVDSVGGDEGDDRAAEPAAGHPVAEGAGRRGGVDGLVEFGAGHVVVVASGRRGRW